MSKRILGQMGPALVVVLIAAVSTVAAAVFSDRSQTQRIADDGATVAAAQRLNATAVGVRSNLGIVILLAISEQAGVEVTDDVDRAVESVRSSLETLVLTADELDVHVGGGVHGAAAREAAENTRAVLAILEDASSATDTAIADDWARTRAIPSLDGIHVAASNAAASAEARIAVEQEDAGDAAWASSLVVALIVPALAVLTLWMSSRRRVERLSLQAEIDKNLALVRTRDELIAGISHQLRTPLTGIVGYADALAANPDDPELRSEGLSIIQSQSGELARMIDDLLVMARLEDGNVAVHKRPLDPAPEVEMVAKLSGPNIQTSLVPALVVGDRLRLRHILTNLVSNAVRHGGPSVVVKAGPSDGWYRIVIADDGAGVPAGQLENVFRPYVHSARDSLITGSLGLGLAVAKQLSDQMGCRLTHQRLNGYTLFVLDIPLAEEAHNKRLTASTV